MPSLYAVADYGAPYLTVGHLAKNKLLPNPAVLPASTADGCAFSPDGSRLAVAHTGSPFITIYNTSDWEVVELLHRASSNGRGVTFVASGGLTVRGSVRDVDNNPAARTVRIYERSTGELCATTTSDPVTGDYSAKVYEGDVDYDAQFLAAPGELLNDLFFARVPAGA
jgi:WD40 repeat protein